MCALHFLFLGYFSAVFTKSAIIVTMLIDDNYSVVEMVISNADKSLSLISIFFSTLFFYR